jgi:hypothetical protein
MPDARTLTGVLLGRSGDPAIHAELLGRLVLDLLMEVEALRRTVKELSDRAGPADAGEDVLAGPRHGAPGPARPTRRPPGSRTARRARAAGGKSSSWSFIPGAARLPNGASV